MPLPQTDILDPWPDVANRHKVRIYSTAFGGVTGLLPEQFTQSFSNQFVAPFATVLTSFNIGVISAQELLAKGGKVDFSAVFKELTNQIWTGTSPLSTTLRLRYVARKSALDDVMRPVQRLIRMSAGTVAGSEGLETATRAVSVTLLKPPVPLLIELGYVLRLKMALIISHSVVWTNINDENGIPVTAEVQLGIKTKRAFVVDDTEVEMNIGGFKKELG